MSSTFAEETVSHLGVDPGLIARADAALGGSVTSRPTTSTCPP
jgi:hypothetical protein